MPTFRSRRPTDSLDDLMSPQPESLTQLLTSPPTSADGIEKYLSSGMIRGIGPVYAKKAGALVRREGVRRHRGQCFLNKSLACKAGL